jgi:GTP-binding protein
MTDLPLVALVGRPNVGKSTLFNRIAGRKLAVINDAPGTTRDRQHADAEWTGVAFTVVDTGGIEALNRVVKGLVDPLAEDSADFIREIRTQAEMAIRDADVIVMVVDLNDGLTPADEEVAEILRRTHKPVIIAANKGDNPSLRHEAYDFYSLGLGEVFSISAVHSTNVGDLLDAVVANLSRQPRESEDDEDEGLKIAILGRPNVGKSSLLNRLLGEERVIVSPVAGTTRDAIDTRIMYHGSPVTLIDTAGIRRRGKIDPGVEKWSVLRALKAIRRADVCLLLIDAVDGTTAQDAHVASFVLDEMKSVIVLVNKWDAIEKDTYTINLYTEEVREALKFLSYVPVEFISAKTGMRTDRVIPLALEIQEQRFVRIPTADLNKIIREATFRQSPPSKSGKRLKIKYASQVDVDPPKLVFHVNDHRLVHFSYQRYLENQIRASYPFAGTPLLMEFKSTLDEDRRKGGKRK